MSAPSKNIPKSRHHVWINDEDWDFLCQAYGSGSVSQVGASQIVREIVHIYVSRLREQANRNLSQPEGTQS